MAKKPTGKPNGRPRRDPTGRDLVVVNVKLTEAERAELRRLASSHHLSLSEFVRVFTLSRTHTISTLNEAAAVAEERAQHRRGMTQLRVPGTEVAGKL